MTEARDVVLEASCESGRLIVMSTQGCRQVARPTKVKDGQDMEVICEEESTVVDVMSGTEIRCVVDSQERRRCSRSGAGGELSLRSALGSEAELVLLWCRRRTQTSDD